MADDVITAHEEKELQRMRQQLGVSKKSHLVMAEEICRAKRK